MKLAWCLQTRLLTSLSLLSSPSSSTSLRVYFVLLPCSLPTLIPSSTFSIFLVNPFLHLSLFFFLSSLPQKKMFCVALTRSLPQPPSVHLFLDTVNCNDVIKELSIDSHFGLFDLLSMLVSGLQETFICLLCDSKLFSTISGLRIASHTINNGSFRLFLNCLKSKTSFLGVQLPSAKSTPRKHTNTLTLTNAWAIFPSLAGIDSTVPFCANDSSQVAVDGENSTPRVLAVFSARVLVCDFRRVSCNSPSLFCFFDGPQSVLCSTKIFESFCVSVLSSPKCCFNLFVERHLEFSFFD